MSTASAALERRCELAESDRDRLAYELGIAQGERDYLRAAMRHVIDASPGTPDSVKKYLVRALEGLWGDPY